MGNGHSSPEYMKKWHEDNKEQQRQYSKARYQKYKAKMLINKREYYAKNREAILEKSRERYKANPETSRKNSRNWRLKNPEAHKANLVKWRTKWHDLVFQHYGQRCSCCGETERMFLTLDHIDGNGREHRRTTKAPSLYKWVVENDYPDNMRILCFNCNCGRQRNGGVCPHHKE